MGDMDPRAAIIRISYGKGRAMVGYNYKDSGLTTRAIAVTVVQRTLMLKQSGDDAVFWISYKNGNYLTMVKLAKLSSKTTILFVSSERMPRIQKVTKNSTPSRKDFGYQDIKVMERRYQRLWATQIWWQITARDSNAKLPCRCLDTLSSIFCHEVDSLAIFKVDAYMNDGGVSLVNQEVKYSPYCFVAADESPHLILVDFI
ncbi:hypothetical protein AVEN_127440-1 [Araneus ventricosus]|uniref:Uncharacterized protein n=1 Tax=Araneus ventricosus TaxID=182803 RepID=A0A4Y2ETK3_ARAVE|nr:hypothetical protein AVEN_127440-1 [Araneus ventricosus]